MNQENIYPQSREEMRELINELVMEALQKRSLAHPGRREKVTKYTDPEGKTWISTTLEKAEVFKKIVATISAAAVLGGLINAIILFPLVDGRIDGKMQAHETAAKARMDAVMPTLVTRSEYNIQLTHQIEANQRMEGTVNEMRSDIKELLKR